MQAILRKQDRGFIQVKIKLSALEEDGIPERLLYRIFQVAPEDQQNDKLGSFYWIRELNNCWVVSAENVDRVH